jgi:hypothetical protein
MSVSVFRGALSNEFGEAAAHEIATRKDRSTTKIADLIIALKVDPLP